MGLCIHHVFAGTRLYYLFSAPLLAPSFLPARDPRPVLSSACIHSWFLTSSATLGAAKRSFAVPLSPSKAPEDLGHRAQGTVTGCPSRWTRRWPCSVDLKGRYLPWPSCPPSRGDRSVGRAGAEPARKPQASGAGCVPCSLSSTRGHVQRALSLICSGWKQAGPGCPVICAKASPLAGGHGVASLPRDVV